MVSKRLLSITLRAKLSLARMVYWDRNKVGDSVQFVEFLMVGMSGFLFESPNTWGVHRFLFERGDEGYAEQNRKRQ